MTQNKEALEALGWIEKNSDDPQLNKLKGLYFKLDTIRKALEQTQERKPVDVEVLKANVRAWRYPDGHGGVSETEYCNQHNTDGLLIDHLASQGHLSAPTNEAQENEAAVLELAKALDDVANSAVDCAQFNYEMMVKRELIHSAEKALKDHAPAIKRAGGE